MNVEPEPKTDKERIDILENRVDGLVQEVAWLKQELSRAFDNMQPSDVPVWAQLERGWIR